MQDAPTIPLNQIFYGPPGTGKTFYVSRAAVEILSKRKVLSKLTINQKFDKIIKIIRQKYSSGEYRVKSNSIYRNDRAIMWMLGYFSHPGLETKGELTKIQAEEFGLKKAPSNWAQRSQFISQFNLTEDWRDSTHLKLNSKGLELLNLVQKLDYKFDKLINWENDCSFEVSNFYKNIFENTRLEDFTPFLKTFFCAFNMLLNNEFFKQPEGRKTTVYENELANKYFDLNPGSNDHKWIGQIGRILQGLGITQINEDRDEIKYLPTELGIELINNIVANWENLYPEIFDQKFNYELATRLGLINFITFHQSYSYEDFLEGIRPNLNNSYENDQNNGNLAYELTNGIFKSICLKAKYDRSNNYVLIIDEINRGIISKIFGELITLIEPSKRLYAEPQEHPQALILPYSKEYFSVPNNLYIIGTMNTADRSITNLDTALRRRFSFKEFRPLYNILGSIIYVKDQKEVEIKLNEILRILNQRIEYLLDKDHLIGHSYFLNIKTWEDLCETFKTNLIPLLQEYFYNDWDKIALTLGDTDAFGKLDDEKLIIKKRSPGLKLFKNDYSGEDIDIYEINPNLINREYNNISENFFLKGFVD